MYNMWISYLPICSPATKSHTHNPPHTHTHIYMHTYSHTHFPNHYSGPNTFKIFCVIPLKQVRLSPSQPLTPNLDSEALLTCAMLTCKKRTESTSNTPLPPKHLTDERSLTEGSKHYQPFISCKSPIVKGETVL